MQCAAAAGTVQVKTGSKLAFHAKQDAFSCWFESYFSLMCSDIISREFKQQLSEELFLSWCPDPLPFPAFGLA